MIEADGSIAQIDQETRANCIRVPDAGGSWFRSRKGPEVDDAAFGLSSAT